MATMMMLHPLRQGDRIAAQVVPTVAVHYTKHGLGLTPVLETDPLPEEQHLLTDYGAAKVVVREISLGGG
jgi:hypothetical protein